MRNAVYQVRLKQVYLAAKTSKNIKILHEANFDINDCADWNVRMQIKSEYDQEITQSQTADQLMVP